MTGVSAGRREDRPALTVVVPTIPGRESLLSRCLWSITNQADTRVDVLVVEGVGRLGDKVNFAACAALGRYMVVVDDDDMIAGDYMAAVLPHLDSDVDMVGYKVAVVIDGRYKWATSIRGDINGWTRSRFSHGPTPKGVTRTDLWRQVPMGNHYTADRDWCESMSRHIKAHAFIDRELYIYDHSTASSAFYEGGQRDVGEWSFDGSRIRRISLESPRPVVG